MTSQSAAAIAPNASTYDGYFFRNNLDAQGEVPADPPYYLSPDIIRSSTPIASPQSDLTTQESLQTLYDCDPDLGQDNYYYLRTLNGGDAGATQLSLHAAAAQLILFPGTWANSPLTTTSGQQSVSASADPGHYAVGDEPFVWNPPAIGGPATFYSFVAQAGNEAPTVSDWLDMGQLVTQQLGTGFHNVGNVSPSQSWESSLGLMIPSSFSDSTTLTLTVSATGFNGCKLGIIASRFTNRGHPVMLNPVQLSNSFTTGFQFSGDPGYEATLYVQCWNGGAPVKAGSTINLTVSCSIPPSKIDEAFERGLIGSRFANFVGNGAGSGVGPQAVFPLGSVTFLAGGG
jgi:hypothetical protein